MSRALRVLITNSALDRRAGTELYVRDLATALLDRGHSPVVYSTVLGEVAQEIRRATVPVVDDLDDVGAPPDLIHGHHHLETMTALLRFPGVPALSVCHGWGPWEETPLRHPRILRYVAIDDTCRDRLISESAVPDARVRVIRNFVDLERFRPRGPLPPRPERALVFSNYANERTHLGAVREACARRGLPVDVMGFTSGTARARPEAEVGSYDIVFAKGRAALEAIAVGAAVVLCDETGVGPMVSTREVDGLRRLNFGIRTLRQPVSADEIALQVARYDPDDASAVSAHIRSTAGRDAAVEEMLRLYLEVLCEHERSTETEPAAEGAAAAAYIRWLSPTLKSAHVTQRERDIFRGEAESLRTERGRLEAVLGTTEARVTTLERAAARASDALAGRDAELARVGADREALRQELSARSIALEQVTADQQRAERDLQRAEQEGGALRPRAEAVAAELDAFRRRHVSRLLDRLRPGPDANRGIAAAFHALRDSAPTARGFRLLPSANLQHVSALSYPLDLPRPGLRGVRLAPIFDLPPRTGRIGIEIVSPQGTLVARGEVPCAEIDVTRPTSVPLLAGPTVEAGPHRLRVFVREAEGSVRFFEWRRHRWRGLGRIETRAFCALLFD